MAIYKKSCLYAHALNKLYHFTDNVLDYLDEIVEKVEEEIENKKDAVKALVEFRKQIINEFNTTGLRADNDNPYQFILRDIKEKKCDTENVIMHLVCLKKSIEKIVNKDYEEYDNENDYLEQMNTMSKANDEFMGIAEDLIGYSIIEEYMKSL